MVAVPADAAAHMKKDLIQRHQDSRDFVRDDLCRMKVPGIQAEEFFIPDGVAEVEFVGTHDITLGADPEELGFDGVKVVFWIDPGSKDFVERLSQALTWSAPVHRRIFGAVRY